ncbi:hypothetical protein [Conexibacter sp. DBS9H8]|uniref:hypothetical protein n=1 Tax=Conexibacter sp. DBS9H8 TaxID=2937801 RepID=UPI0020106903|nr:hypothetical protein [Conexibacter sp. DBS9H8]
MSRPAEEEEATDPTAAPVAATKASRAGTGKGSSGNRSKSKNKGKGKGRRGAAPEAGALPSVAGHPRARASVTQIKAGVGLGAFGLALMLSLKASVPLVMAAERALIAGVCGYVIAWGCAVAVWRALLAAELRARADALRAAREDAGRPAR